MPQENKKFDTDIAVLKKEGTGTGVIFFKIFLNNGFLGKSFALRYDEGSYYPDTVQKILSDYSILEKSVRCAIVIKENALKKTSVYTLFGGQRKIDSYEIPSFRETDISHPIKTLVYRNPLLASGHSDIELVGVYSKWADYARDHTIVFLNGKLPTSILLSMYPIEIEGEQKRKDIVPIREFSPESLILKEILKNEPEYRYIEVKPSIAANPSGKPTTADIFYIEENFTKEVKGLKPKQIFDAVCDLVDNLGN